MEALREIVAKMYAWILKHPIATVVALVYIALLLFFLYLIRDYLKGDCEPCTEGSVLSSSVEGAPPKQTEDQEMRVLSSNEQPVAGCSTWVETELPGPSPGTSQSTTVEQTTEMNDSQSRWNQMQQSVTTTISRIEPQRRSLRLSQRAGVDATESQIGNSGPVRPGSFSEPVTSQNTPTHRALFQRRGSARLRRKNSKDKDI